MALNLIRKNNQAEVTAYQDTVLFHAMKGINGVFPNVGDAFALSYNSTNQQMTINSGMGMLYGRQFEILEGDTIVWDWSALTGVKYISVYIEIDLRDPTAETAAFKSTYASLGFPTITDGDNLIINRTGVARMLMFYIYRNSSGSMTITQKYNSIRDNWIANADFATFCNASGISGDSSKVGGNSIFDSFGILKLNMRSSQTITDIITYKRVLWSGSQIFNQTTNIGTQISITDNISSGDFLEIVYKPFYTSNNTITIQERAVVGDIGIIENGSSVPGVTFTSIISNAIVNNGISASSNSFTVSGKTLIYRGGQYLSNFANDGGHVYTTFDMRLLRIYKIVGGNNR